MMKNSNVKPLEPCPLCGKNNVFASYKENARYRFVCGDCGQYFEFNAPSQFAADLIFNEIIRGRVLTPSPEKEEVLNNAKRID